jgi:uncharacterized protein (DUF488 family)
MLAEAGGRLNKLDLVKLLFLLREEHPSLPKSAAFEFVPYHHGPYSFTLAHDLKNLEQSGLLRQTTRKISLTSLGKSMAAKTPAELGRPIRSTYARHGQQSTDDLIDHVYKSFPWYTVNSKWKERRSQLRPTAEIAIYTTSYEGVQLDGLLDRLIRHGIHRLIDVRANPVARRFGFHKSTLARICPKVGIEYIHVPEVGIPGAWRADLNTFDSYQRLFHRYEAEVLRIQRDALERLSAWIREMPSALMCKEANAHCCHRTTLAQRLTGELGLPVIDIDSEVICARS